MITINFKMLQAFSSHFCNAVNLEAVFKKLTELHNWMHHQGDKLNCPTSNYEEIQKYRILLSEELSMTMKFLTESGVKVLMPASCES